MEITLKLTLQEANMVARALRTQRGFSQFNARARNVTQDERADALEDLVTIDDLLEKVDPR